MAMTLRVLDELASGFVREDRRTLDALIIDVCTRTRTRMQTQKSESIDPRTHARTHA